VVNIGAEDFLKRNRYLILALIWQIIRFHLLSHVNLKEHPEMVKLVQTNEDISAVLSQPENGLLRWFNYHLANAGHPRRVNNFSNDVQDGENYLVLLSEVAPQVVSKSVLAEKDPQRRAAMVCDYANRLGVHPFVTPQDILAGNNNLNLAFTADIFNKLPGIQVNGYSEQQLRVLKNAELELQHKWEEAERLRTQRWLEEDAARTNKWAMEDAERAKIKAGWAKEDEERRRQQEEQERMHEEYMRQLEEKPRMSTSGQTPQIQVQGSESVTPGPQPFMGMRQYNTSPIPGPAPMNPRPVPMNPGPMPMNPGPMNPGPMSMMNPRPIPMNPGPMNPGPMNPGSMNPGPMNPGSMNPGSMNPGSMNPGSMNPGPMNPGSMNPGPMNPGPMPMMNPGPMNLGPMPMMRGLAPPGYGYGTTQTTTTYGAPPPPAFVPTITTTRTTRIITPPGVFPGLFVNTW